MADINCKGRNTVEVRYMEELWCSPFSKLLCLAKKIILRQDYEFRFLDDKYH